MRQELNRTHAVGPGGTANLAVLGGNLPPSRTHDARSPFGARVVRTAVGRVARQNGPVARSTRNSDSALSGATFRSGSGSIGSGHPVMHGRSSRRARATTASAISVCSCSRWRVVVADCAGCVAAICACFQGSAPLAGVMLDRMACVSSWSCCFQNRRRTKA